MIKHWASYLIDKNYSSVMQYWDADICCRARHRGGNLCAIKDESIILADLFHGEGLVRYDRSGWINFLQHIKKRTDLWGELKFILSRSDTVPALHNLITLLESQE